MQNIVVDLVSVLDFYRVRNFISLFCCELLINVR